VTHVQGRVPQQSRSHRTRGAIIQAAAEVFNSKGYKTASIAQIAYEAHTTKGSIYYHFISKEGLALAVIQEQQERTLRTLTAVDTAPGVDVLEALITVSKTLVDQVRSDIIVRAGMMLTLDDDVLAASAPEFYRDCIEKIAHLVEEGITRGHINQSVQPDSFACSTIAYFCGSQLLSDVLTGCGGAYTALGNTWVLLLPVLAPRCQAQL
jgi:AcrR family transcriptional regulator